MFSRTIPVIILLLTAACPSAAQSRPGPAAVPTSQPASTPVSQPAVGQTTTDPFAHLRMLIPPDQLPPLRSIRLRDKLEQQERSHKGTIRVRVGSRPKGVAVYYGGKLLGTTPLTLTAHRGSRPMDVVLKKSGYMVLHTRIRRREDRSYFFKMTPAKIR
jgi:hypothetical protein